MKSESWWLIELEAGEWYLVGHLCEEKGEGVFVYITKDFYGGAYVEVSVLNINNKILCFLRLLV